jgi:hypothetical protein
MEGTKVGVRYIYAPCGGAAKKLAMEAKVLGFFFKKKSESTELDEFQKFWKVRTGIHYKFEQNLNKFEQTNFLQMAKLGARHGEGACGAGVECTGVREGGDNTVPAASGADGSNGHVHSAYNPSFSACFFSRNSIFSHNKSANNVFQPAYQHSRTAPTSPQRQ